MKKINSPFIIFLIFSLLLSLQLASLFSRTFDQTILIGISIRSAHLVFALVLTALSFRGKISYALTAFMVFSMYLQIFATSRDGALSLEAYNYIPVFFLIASLGFEGQPKVWWRWVVPFSVPPFIIPLFFKDPVLFTTFSAISSNFMTTIFSICTSFGVIFFIFERIRHRKQIEQLNQKQGEIIRIQAQEIANGLVEREIGKVARQVAHDIRSPISALKAVEKIMTSDPIGSLKLLSQSIRRVSEISDDLLIRSKTITEYKEFNLIESIEQIIEEKNSALSKNRKIKIEVNPCTLDTDRSSYTLRGEKSLFLRAISNVIQNSIDAVTDDGRIEISLKKSDRLIELIISDNGVGIPDNIISSLKTDPRSHNKPTGNGLGLRSTIDYLKSVGGRIDISSREGQGTSISLFHPSTSV